MIVVYRRHYSLSARLLAYQLGGLWIRERAYHRGPIVAWGEWWPGALNGDAPLRAKITDAEILRQKGVATIDVQRDCGWLPRRNRHVGGNDLLRAPDFYARRERLVHEFRVHTFQGRSLRAGEKIHRVGIDFQPHPWIRAHQTGWRVSYRGVAKPIRRLARSAVAALGLDFGAVDIGQREDESLLVLEVNRAPGIEAGTLAAYTHAIKEWAGC
jgi:hypothetical protein